MVSTKRDDLHRQWQWSLNQLSLGQQKSILLSILLQSKSKVPLLIGYAD